VIIGKLEGREQVVMAEITVAGSVSLTGIINNAKAPDHVRGMVYMFSPGVTMPDPELCPKPE
jgi:hypothetical protein